MHDLKVKVTDLELLFTFYVKFLDLIISKPFDGFGLFGMMIDTGPKFYTVPSPPPYMTLRSRSQT